MNLIFVFIKGENYTGGLYIFKIIFNPLWKIVSERNEHCLRTLEGSVHSHLPLSLISWLLPHISSYSGSLGAPGLSKEFWIQMRLGDVGNHMATQLHWVECRFKAWSSAHGFYTLSFVPMSPP